MKQNLTWEEIGDVSLSELVVFLNELPEHIFEYCLNEDATSERLLEQITSDYKASIKTIGDVSKRIEAVNIFNNIDWEEDFLKEARFASSF
jgi:hypothetical protein